MEKIHSIQFDSLQYPRFCQSKYPTTSNWALFVFHPFNMCSYDFETKCTNFEIDYIAHVSCTIPKQRNNGRWTLNHLAH